jgi:rhodanese-related sulfurtransferase
MSKRRVKIVLLCEDSQQEAFTRRFLKGMRWNTREIRVEKSPSALGSAEQWVREKFPHELIAYRQRQERAASALIAMIDADNRDVQNRINEFEEECNSMAIAFRTDGEAVAIAVPKRNIETWIHFLSGDAVDENTSYPKLGKERGCKPAVDKLVQLCKSTGLTPNAPQALATACDEYNTRIRPLA